MSHRTATIDVAGEPEIGNGKFKNIVKQEPIERSSRNAPTAPTTGSFQCEPAPDHGQVSESKEYRIGRQFAKPISAFNHRSAWALCRLNPLKHSQNARRNVHPYPCWLSLSGKSPRITARTRLAGCGKTRFEAEAVPQNSLVSTTQPDKKKACVEKTSNSWMCLAM